MKSPSLNDRVTAFFDVQVLNALASNPIVTGLISQTLDTAGLAFTAALASPIATSGFNKTLNVLLINANTVMKNKFFRSLFNESVHTFKDIYRRMMPNYSAFNYQKERTSGSNEQGKPNQRPPNNKPRNVESFENNIKQKEGFNPLKFGVNILGNMWKNFDTAMKNSNNETPENII